jgi:hypothetical protein
MLAGWSATDEIRPSHFFKKLSLLIKVDWKTSLSVADADSLDSAQANADATTDVALKATGPMDLTIGVRRHGSRSSMECFFTRDSYLDGVTGRGGSGIRPKCPDSKFSRPRA